ncbi:tape measure protein [Nesterenkonia jeotgali]|uniref:Tape measure protein N-terminal domain-containing protein n=1 Tax=Nesterenkonia jeotgali TaxID=317018 RepID=A0A0W8IGA6_9MICC|nr:tape measure protein [Nesterenkonia jeotgali]KUG58986.1 hypothetical protein AVL63_02895 [Nesterenkonia jeotgali]
MADRNVTVRLSAEVSGFTAAMNLAERSASQVADSADQAASSTERMGQANQAAAGGVSASSEALARMSGGLETAAPAADQVATSVERVSTAGSESSGALFRMSEGLSGVQSTGDAAHQSILATSSGMDGLVGSFQEGLTFGGGFRDTLGAVGSTLGGTVAGGFRQAGDATRDFLTTAQGLSSEFTQVGAVLGVVGGGLIALSASVIQTGIAYNTLQQVAGRAMETMTGSTEAAAVQMERLHQFADESPFARDTWISAQQQLMAFGMEAERVVPTLEGVQNAVAAIGGGDQEIMQLVDILGTVEGQGRITGRELQRLGQMGINAAELIGSSMGVSGNEIREQITAGTLDASTAITALTDGMNVRFAGAAEGLRDTMTGALDRIRARVRDLGSIIAAPLVDPTGGGFLVEAINQAADFGSSLLELNPALIQFAGLGTLAAGGLITLAAGFFMVAPRLLSFWDSIKETSGLIRDFATNLPGMSTGLRNAGIAAGVAVAAIAGLAIIGKLTRDSEAFAASVGDMGRELRTAARGGEAFASIDWTMASNGPTDLAGAFERITSDGLIDRVNDSVNLLLYDLFGISGEASDLQAQWESMDQAMAEAFQAGRFDEVAAGLQKMVDVGMEADQLTELFPEVSEAIRQAANEAGYAATNQEILAVATDATALAALAAGAAWEEVESATQGAAATTRNSSELFTTLAEGAEMAASGISDLVGNMNEYAGIALSAEATSDAWIESLQELRGELSDGEFSMNRYSEKGLENREMLRGLAEDTWEAAAAQADLEGNQQAALDVINDSISIIREAGEAANMSAGDIDDMIRRYLGFNDVEPIEIQAENRAAAIFDEVELQLGALPDDFEIWISAQSEEAQAVIAGLLDQDLETVMGILADPALAEEVITAFEAGDYQAIVDLMAQAESAQMVVYDFISGEYQAQVDIQGNAVPANEALAALMNGDYTAVADILGDTTEAFLAVRAFEAGDYSTVAEILGNNAPAAAEMAAFLNGSYSTTASINGDDGPARGTMNNFTGTDWRTTATAQADTAAAEYALGPNGLTRTRTVTIRTAISGSNLLGNTSSGGPTLGGGYTGGRVGRIPNTGSGLQGYTSGGRPNSGYRLPSTGLGTDQILGVNGAGMPVARVDDLEWIVNRRSSDKYNRLLGAINRDDPRIQHLAGFTSGGRPGYQGQVREFAGSSGASPRITARDIASALGGGSGRKVEFNITNHHPRAEATSTTIKNATDYMGAGAFE